MTPPPQAATTSTVLTADDHRVKIPLLGFIAGAFISLAFVTGALDALLSNHFNSWHRLTLRPENGVARAIEGLMPTLRVVAMLGAAGFGYTTLRRIEPDSYKPTLIRLGLVAFSPIFVEVLDFGTQDGSVPDLDKLPVHSMVLLVALVLVPGLVALWDAASIRRSLRSSPPGEVG